MKCNSFILYEIDNIIFAINYSPPPKQIDPSKMNKEYKWHQSQNKLSNQ